ncbi:MAG: Panacea domain-containing protein [Chloroflexota bacterium]
MAQQPQFNEAKAAQAAALLLRLRGGRMHYLKLLKLLYIADREAIRRWGVSVTMDHYVSMDHGPVPSNTYRLMVDDIAKPNWRRLISPPLGEYEVELVATEVYNDLLSRAEEALLNEVYAHWGSRSRWDIVEHVHTYSEWRNPRGSAVPIHLRDILLGVGFTEDDARAVQSELGAEAAAERALSEPL